MSNILVDNQIESILKGIGTVLQAERTNRKILQKDAASDLNIARAHLSKIENGKRKNMSISTLIRLCDYYNMKLSEVIEKAKLYSEYL